MFSFFCIVSIVLLGVNIFRIVRKGYERYEIIQMEKSRLEELIQRKIELQEDLKYYSSKEYIDLKAREELNLAFPNQRLVRIEREEELGISDEQNETSNELVPSWRLWYELIF